MLIKINVNRELIREYGDVVRTRIIKPQLYGWKREVAKTRRHLKQTNECPTCWISQKREPSITRKVLCIWPQERLDKLRLVQKFPGIMPFKQYCLRKGSLCVCLKLSLDHCMHYLTVQDRFSFSYCKRDYFPLFSE